VRKDDCLSKIDVNIFIRKRTWNACLRTLERELKNNGLALACTFIGTLYYLFCQLVIRRVARKVHIGCSQSPLLDLPTYGSSSRQHDLQRETPF
jgi:hypothetical protein